MTDKSYFHMQLDSTIRKIEKLLKLLRTIGESRDLKNALQMSVTAAKISEGVALKTRALPAHTVIHRLKGRFRRRSLNPFR